MSQELDWSPSLPEGSSSLSASVVDSLPSLLSVSGGSGESEFFWGCERGQMARPLGDKSKHWPFCLSSSGDISQKTSGEDEWLGEDSRLECCRREEGSGEERAKNLHSNARLHMHSTDHMIHVLFMGKQMITSFVFSAHALRGL